MRMMIMVVVIKIIIQILVTKSAENADRSKETFDA
jgi:hypothetical protein